tara:strand:+ start:6491 stop:7420 length:930 start_codon:yes stop_codon:yes gene_type:complete
MKTVVITSIYPISQATKKFALFEDWNLIIVGDKKTPHQEYIELSRKDNVFYLTPEYQEENYKELSDLLGWNNIERKNIGYLEAIKMGAEIIANMDDDNIPLDNWGKNLLVGKEVNVYYYETDETAFDPIGVTNHNNLWHRGFPLQLLKERQSKYKITRKKIKVDVQADFWNGDPDIDAICRFEHSPMCFFDDKYFPLASNSFSPFNSQNTFFSREAMKKYLLIPGIGRMEDIWSSYYLESLGFNVVYNKASVFQDRNIQNYTKNMKDEFIGYEKTIDLLNDLKEDSENIYKYLPERGREVMKKYINYFN